MSVYLNVFSGVMTRAGHLCKCQRRVQPLQAAEGVSRGGRKRAQLLLWQVESAPTLLAFIVPRQRRQVPARGPVSCCEGLHCRGVRPPIQAMALYAQETERTGSRVEVRHAQQQDDTPVLRQV